MEPEMHNGRRFGNLALDQNVQPGANTAVLKQRVVQGLRIPAPVWDFTTTTAATETQGLTTDEMKRIASDINKKSAADYDGLYNPMYGQCFYLPAMLSMLGGTLLFIGIFLWIDPGGSPGADRGSPGALVFIGAAMFVIFCCLHPVMTVVVGRNWMIANSTALMNMKQYVEGTLNPEWQSRNVKWEVVTVKTVDTLGSSRKTRIKYWYDIHATGPAMQVQQVPAGVQMMQGPGGQLIPVQVVTVQNGAPVQVVQAQSGQTIQYSQGGAVQTVPVQYMQEQAGAQQTPPV